jgi:hypothetical protein
MLLTSLSMVIASTQTRHRSAYIPDHGGDGWPLLLNWHTGVRRGLQGTVKTTVQQELIRMEATVLPDDYLTAADEMLSQAHTFPSDSDPAAASRLEAQVKAIQAVAAAIDRLAAAVEALSPPSPPPYRPGGNGF